ncbi:MAG TPA: DUF1800 domain-containing protein [Verrucomicrobiae bacterium]|jgi:uncharacterized protein (DUF1800 family)|nr:DUF1800 domain-containing protein [Verrucomicrobiae bacterium]
MLQPLSASKWDFTTAAHLLNRAGFGGTPDDVHKLVALGHEGAVSSLIDFDKIPEHASDPDWAHPDPGHAERRRAAKNAAPEQRQQMQKQERQLENQRILELRGWWLQRMARGPRPFQEKMTLFWHGHFATSYEKVRDAYYMWRQNELFRRLAVGNWLDLLTEAGKDPAMLVWLDQAQSRKDHPNENFAREVMELFALGEGHYTEKDIAEAARALTGWSLDPDSQKFLERPFIHDRGEKTVLGKTGNLNGDDFIAQIIAQPQAALFITAKLWTFFAGEMPSPELNAGLADLFRRGGNNFKPLMRVIFSTEEFYSPSVVRNEIKSPVQWLIGSVRMLECELPPPLVSTNLLRSLGQDLFAPPNVKGWDGGLAWITTNNLLARYNQAAMLAQGDMAIASSLATGPVKNPARVKQIQRRMQNMRAGGVDVEKIFTEQERSDKEMLIAALEKRLLQASLTSRQEHALREYLDGKNALDENDIRDAIRLVMCTPDYQVT